MSLAGGGTERLAVMVSGPFEVAEVGLWVLQVRMAMLAACCGQWGAQGRCSRGWTLVSEATDVTPGSYHFSFFGGGGLVGRNSVVGDGGGPL